MLGEKLFGLFAAIFSFNRAECLEARPACVEDGARRQAMPHKVVAILPGQD